MTSTPCGCASAACVRAHARARVQRKEARRRRGEARRARAEEAGRIAFFATDSRLRHSAQAGHALYFAGGVSGGRLHRVWA
eukprot:2628241-Pleurochrysis_carterae.AAC.1